MFTKPTIQRNRVLYFLKKSQRFFVVGHTKPDGDSVGSMLALCLVLTKLGKQVIMACHDELPERFHFLPGAGNIKVISDVINQLRDIEVVISVDCGSYDLTGLGDRLQTDSRPLFLNIDHHHDNPGYGDINIIEGDKSSTAEIIYNLIETLGIKIDGELATCILNGIFVDTDSFKNPNTSVETLRITSDLLSRGASLRQIAHSNLKDKSLTTLKLWGTVLARIKKNRKLGIISTAVTNKDLVSCQASHEDLDGIANFLNSVPDAKTSLVLSERDDNEIKGSLRTLHDDVDVSKLAAILGGGGHKKAAGFTLPGKIVNQGGRWKIV